MTRANRHDQFAPPPRDIRERKKRSTVDRKEHDANKENKAMKKNFAHLSVSHQRQDQAGRRTARANPPTTRFRRIETL